MTAGTERARTIANTFTSDSAVRWCLTVAKHVDRTSDTDARLALDDVARRSDLGVGPRLIARVALARIGEAGDDGSVHVRAALRQQATGDDATELEPVLCRLLELGWIDADDVLAHLSDEDRPRPGRELVEALLRTRVPDAVRGVDVERLCSAETGSFAATFEHIVLERIEAQRDRAHSADALRHAFASEIADVGARRGGQAAVAAAANVLARVARDAPGRTTPELWCRDDAGRAALRDVVELLEVADLLVGEPSLVPGETRLACLAWARDRCVDPRVTSALALAGRIVTSRATIGALAAGHVGLVIPYFDESQRLATDGGSIATAKLDQLAWAMAANPRIRWHVVFVDDGSSDDSRALVEAAVARWCASGSPDNATISFAAAPSADGGQRTSRKGGAIKAGLRALVATGVDFAGYVDIDETYCAAEIGNLLQPMIDLDDVAMVSVNRADRDSTGYYPAGVVPAHVQSHRERTTEVTGLSGLPDAQAGFKLLRASVLSDVLGSVETDGLAVDVELACALVRYRRQRVVSVPVACLHHWIDGQGSRTGVDYEELALDVRDIAQRTQVRPTAAAVEIGRRPR